jgi:hypothetical protein
MLGFDRFSAAISFALSGLYPARIAACVAFKSIKYSSTNRCCFAVNLPAISPPREYKYPAATATGHRQISTLLYYHVSKPICAEKTEKPNNF